jgi:hypothetical protein
MFDLVNVCGEVVIGEGKRDQAPGIFKGEHLGTWKPGSHKFDLAVDPIDGTANVSKGFNELDLLRRSCLSGRRSRGFAEGCSNVLHDETGLRL